MTVLRMQEYGGEREMDWVLLRPAAEPADATDESHATGDDVVVDEF